MTISKSLAPALCALLIVGCGDDDVNEANYTAPLEYDFSSRTNTEFGSSVSNTVPVIQALMANELMAFIGSPDISGLSSGSIALARLNQIFKVGTVIPVEDADISLGNYDVYRGVLASSTPINLNTEFPLLQEFFGDLHDPVKIDLDGSRYTEVEADEDIDFDLNLIMPTNLSGFVSSLSRPLPFTTMTNIDVNGTSFEIEVGDFIGWPIIGDVNNGNSMPLKLLDSWLEEVSVLMTDDDLSSASTNDSGIHLNELISHLILGAVNYSSISQFNLISDKGLIKQNSKALNISEVTVQENNLKEAEAGLERIDKLIESSEEDLIADFESWKAQDPEANPLNELIYYTSKAYYGPLSLAEAYFDTVETIEIRVKSKLEAEKRLVKTEALIDNILPFTDLANNWDEAFGYFGASRSYGLHSDLEIAEKPYFDDVEADGVIDAFTEMNFGYAVLASQRDAGAALANTDFSGNIWNAFLMGRQIIQQNHGREAIEDVGYHNELKAQADIVVENLEKVIAASVIHNINATIADINSVLGESEVVPEGVDLSEFDSVSFSYYKNWSKLKGMTLTLQFNDNPTISKENLVKVHELIGELPRPGESLTEEVVDAGEEAAPIVNNYAARRYDLKTARDIIRDTYGFAEANAAAW
jgi:hypothetical protein